MNRKSFALLLIASSLASSTFSANIFDKIKTKHVSVNSSIVKTHAKLKPTNPLYTDFSGTWMVKCDDGNNMTTVIENDANYITLDGVEYRIGQGIQTLSNANENNTSYDHTSIEWSANGSVLTIKGVGFSKYNVDNSSIETNLNAFTLAMKNGQINLDGQLFIFEDLTPIGQSITVHCVLSKKQ